MSSSMLKLNSHVYRIDQGILERCLVIGPGLFDEQWVEVSLASLSLAEQKSIREYFKLD